MLLLLVHYATSYSPKVIPSNALSYCLTAYQGSSPVARDADIILLTDNKTRLVYIMEMVKFWYFYNSGYISYILLDTMISLQTHYYFIFFKSCVSSLSSHHNTLHELDNK